MKRPNILFAFADDWGRYASAYRELERGSSLNELVDTPNFDRVAREGILFSNAFVPAPSCTPCRSSVLTGQYFWETGLGAILQGAVWDSSIPSYPLLLEEAGYHIGYAYKVWGPGTPPNEPYGGARTRYMPSGSRFGRFSHFVTEKAPEIGVEEAKALLLEETLCNFDAFLDARSDRAPFCYWWGPTNTHRSWERGSGRSLWGLNPDDLEGRLPQFLPDVHEVREDVCDYLGECLAFDAGLGTLLTRLEEIGELDNTLVVVSGDHGIPGFPRGKCNLYDIGAAVALAARWPGRIPPGRIVDDVVNLMDLAPTFLEAAGLAPPECTSGSSMLDVLTSQKDGAVDPERTFVVTGRERHVARAREGNLPYPQRAVRTKDFLYVLNFAPDRWPAGDPAGMDDPTAQPPDYEELANNTFLAYPDMDAGPTKAWMIHHRNREDVRESFELGFGKRIREELYDLKKDPCCMINAADDPEYESVRTELYAKLMRVLRDNNDPRITDEVCRFERPPFTDPPPGRRKRSR